MSRYRWLPREQFVNRSSDLAELEAWWESPTRDALALVGRRRVGKSWLFRRFADGRPAVILVADRRLIGTQMARFASTLEPELGLRPELGSLAELLRVLYELGRERRILAVIDEFPLLLPDGRAREEVLGEAQAVMEDHRDLSRTKLLLCGSLIGQMESLLHARSPLHGRLRRLDVWPLSFAESRPLTERSDTPQERVTRYAVAGGMARYLGELGMGPLREAVCRGVLDRRGPLFDDPRAALEQELRRPATYFSILEALANAPASTERLARELRMTSSALAPYLKVLREMRLLSSAQPVGAPAGARNHRHRITDGFTRFWFRFVFPNQEDLEEGLAPRDLWDTGIEPYLADFVAPVFEELCIRYVRLAHGARVTRVGGWWGPALHKHRRARERLSEEIDFAAARRRKLEVVGECKWTHRPMSRRVLDELRTYKIPAVAQERRLTLPAAGPRILLFARFGFSSALREAAARDDDVELIGVEELVRTLDDGAHRGRRS